MIKALKKDFHRYYRIELGDNSPTFIKKIRLLLNMPGLQAILIYRFCHLVKVKKINNPFVSLLLQPLCWPLNFLTSHLYGIEISPYSTVGAGFYIGHFSGIQINNAVIGENCSVHQHVSIGASSQEEQAKTCHIGNNVWIGAHSHILPGINIGQDSTIAAGSVVAEDLPKRVLAMGNPARVTQKDYNNSSLM